MTRIHAYVGIFPGGDFQCYSQVISPGDLEYESRSQKTIESRVYSSVKEHDPRFISFGTLSASDGHTHTHTGHLLLV